MKRVFCILISVFLLFSVSYKTGAVSAKSAVVINGDTGDIIYSVNSDVRLPMASTTKIMTALLLLENCKDLDEEIITTKEMVTVEGSSMGLLAGDRVSYRSLLYGMMLSSGNDAANTVAVKIGGSVDGFVKMMNDRAVKLGLSNTRFATPSGLDGEGHYTTAYELALIAREALKIPEFLKAVSTKSITLSYGNPPYRRTVTNHNKLLKMYDDVIGVKTGFTKKAGRCLVSAAKKDGKYVIAVTLNDGDDWADHRFLLDTGLSAIEVYGYKPESLDMPLNIVSSDKDTMSADMGTAEFCVVKGENVSAKVCCPKFLYAPIDKNEIIGNIEYYCLGRLIYKSNIISKEDCKCEKSSKVRLIYDIFRYMMSII